MSATAALRSGAAVCFLCISAIALPAAARAADPVPGAYSGKAKGATVRVTISDALDAKVRYSLKTGCGRTHGKVALGAARKGAYAGKRVSRGPEGTTRTTAIKLRVASGGEAFAVTATDSLKGGDSDLAGCRARRRLTAKIIPLPPFEIARDTGHYAGASSGGRPISFDVVAGTDGSARIENLAVDVLAECSDDAADDDAPDFPLVVHLTGLAGPVNPDGTFRIVQAPDQDTENLVSGDIGGGAARVAAEVLGQFNPDGTPNPLGTLACLSFGERYEASRA